MSSTRRNVKRVDYTKYGTSGPETDDDFEESSPVTKQPKKTSEITKRNERKEKQETKERGRAESQRRAPKKQVSSNENTSRKRTSKTSTAEEVFEQDLLTAIECSKSDALFVDSSKKQKISKVIALSESEDESIVIKKRIKKSKQKVTDEDSSDEVTELDSPLPDTVPVKRNEEPVFAAKEENGMLKEKKISRKDKSLTKKKSAENSTTFAEEDCSGETKEDSSIFDTVPIGGNEDRISSVINEKKLPMKERKMNTKINSTIAEKKSPVKKNSTRISKNKSEVNRTPTIPVRSSPSLTNTEKAITPGRLRLGLSRNVRVAKPLHSNVNVG